MIYFPFDNESEEVQDRNIGSDVFADYLKRIIGTNGIFANLGTKLQVLSGSGMNVSIKAGDGFIEGRLFVEIEDTSYPLFPSESLDRIDRMVIRLDKQERTVAYYLIKGTAQTVPIAPNVVREGDIYDLAIADIYITRNTTSITQLKITDLRLNSQLCGIVPIFGSVDTTKLYTQIQKAITDFEKYVNDKTTAWNAQMLSQQVAYELQRDVIDAWYADIRTAVFAKMQLNFDNWLYMPGHTYKTRFNSNGSISERIANTLTDKTFCERLTTFTNNGVSENIRCDEFELNMVKTSNFLPDGSIDEIVTGKVGLLEPSGGGNIALHNLLSNLAFEKSGHVGFASEQEVIQIRQDLLGVKENLQSALTVLNGGV